MAFWGRKGESHDKKDSAGILAEPVDWCWGLRPPRLPDRIACLVPQPAGQLPLGLPEPERDAEHPLQGLRGTKKKSEGTRWVAPSFL